MSSTALDIDSFCKYSKLHAPFFANWFKDFSWWSTKNEGLLAVPLSFIRRFQQVAYNADIKEEEICKHNLKTGVAAVKFQLVTQTVTQIEKKERFTRSDIVSNIGRFDIFLIIPLCF